MVTNAFARLKRLVAKKIGATSAVEKIAGRVVDFRCRGDSQLVVKTQRLDRQLTVEAYLSCH